MNKLIEIIQKLKSDVYAAITVIDKAKPLQKVCTDQTGQMLIEKHGSIENFFETLNKNGVKELLVIVRRKNGSTFKEDSKYAPIEMSFEPKAQDQQNYSQAQSNAQSQNSMNWLAGGLNQADAIYKMMDHTRLVQEVEKLAAKNEILEKDNNELRDKNLRNEISGSNSAANAEMLKTFAPLLMPLVNKLVAAPDAAASLAQPNLSPLKQQFVTIAQSMDDETLNDLIFIMQNFANAEFVAELNNLIMKYNAGS